VNSQYKFGITHKIRFPHSLTPFRPPPPVLALRIHNTNLALRIKFFSRIAWPISSTLALRMRKSKLFNTELNIKEKFTHFSHNTKELRIDNFPCKCKAKWRKVSKLICFLRAIHFC
jgi:hypothetical protein